MIEIKNIVKHFSTTTALNGVNLNIKNKDFFGLLGPNGAGKSTLMNLLIGYLDSDDGEIRVDGEVIKKDNLSIRNKIGLVPQSISLYDDISAIENLEIFGSFYGIKKNLLRAVIAENLNRVQLFERRKDKVKNFSGGMKRRLNIAASLLHDPDILLCDEPTVGVDPQSRNAIFDYLLKLNNEGKTIVYTTHYMEEAARLCNNIAIIDAGKIIAEGTLDQLLEKLPYDQTILISKNPNTENKLEFFKAFGTIINDQEKYELKPENDLKLSEFFKVIEEKEISYNSIDLKKPTLEALFLHLTGRRLRD